MVTIEELPRVFIYKEKNTAIKLDDPNKMLTPDEVLSFYTGSYPEFISARIEGPEIKDDKIQFRIVPIIGTKG